MIVVASHAADAHAARVLAGLAARGHPASLIDTAAFPSRAALAIRFGHRDAADDGRTWQFTTGEMSIDLDAVGTVWWRRPQPFTLDPSIDPGVASFAYSECHEALTGMWHGLRAEWVNPPAADEVAHHKPYQLAVATDVGLTVPATLITNDADEARSFIAERGPANTVYKTFLATEVHWRETRVVRPNELGLLDRVALAPVIFQERIVAEANLRVTVVGDRTFAAEINTEAADYDLDYRVDMEAARFRPVTLPTHVQVGVRTLLDRLGLVYGAVDLLRTPAGDHVFLEVNPAGEWLFVEERTDQPITTAMVDLLCDLDTMPDADNAGPLSHP